MPGAAGFPWSFVIDGSETSWKSIDVTDGNPGVDASARLNPDGSTNEGFSDREGDLNTMTIRLTDCAHSASDVRGDAAAQLFGLEGGDRSTTANWAVYYDDILFNAGTGYYVRERTGSGQIPGEGRVSITLESIGEYS